MSQHDMILDNASGATFRADANAALQALASSSKGNTAPATPYSGQPWVDDNTPSTAKWTESVFDGTDWIKKAEIDTSNNLYVPQVGGGTATVASATTTDLGSVFEASVTVSGTTTITAFGSSAPKGVFKLVTFAGALTLTHNATSLILPGGASIPTAAGDTAVCEHLGSGNWKVHHYTPASGLSVGGGRYKVGSFTRDTSLASGTQAVTGVGFRPQSVDFLANITTGSQFSTGFSDGTTHGSVADYGPVNAGGYSINNNAVLLYSAAANYAGSVNSLDADGFTMGWTKTGSTTGTATIYYRAMR